MDEGIVLEKILSMLVIGMTGIGLTFARRYNNKDKDAGIGVSFSTLVLVGLIWFLTS